MKDQDSREYLTPPEIAKLLRVGVGRVSGWIKRGELIGVNVSDSKIRPRFRVSREDLDAFLARRRPAPPERKRRRQPEPKGVTQYF